MLPAFFKTHAVLSKYFTLPFVRLSLPVPEGGFNLPFPKWKLANTFRQASASSCWQTSMVRQDMLRAVISEFARMRPAYRLCPVVPLLRISITFSYSNYIWFKYLKVLKLLACRMQKPIGCKKSEIANRQQNKLSQPAQQQPGQRPFLSCMVWAACSRLS